MDSSPEIRWSAVKTGSTAVDLVVSNIRKALEDGQLRPGSRLPSESELSANMDVSRGTIREAMKILKAYGVVQVQQGSGTFIADNSEQESSNALLFSFLLLNPDKSECWEYREFLERHVLEKAITLATAEDIAELKRNLEETKRLAAEGGNCAELDLQFHAYIGSLSDNRLLKSEYSAVMRFLAASFYNNHQHKDHVLKTLSTHKETIAAIEERDYSAIDRVLYHTQAVWKSESSKRI